MRARAPLLWDSIVGMSRVCLTHHRPGLAAALCSRGIEVVRAAQASALVVPTTHSDKPSALVAAIRRHWRLPLLLIVADDEAVIAAIDAGADEAVSETASDTLVAARTAALIRRGGARWLGLGELAIDTIERRVWRAGRPIALLPREYRLLLELALKPGEAVTRADLLKRVCGVGFDPGTNVLDVHMSRLRAKLDRGFGSAMLRTEKGVGYRLAAPTADFAIEGALAAV